MSKLRLVIGNKNYSSWSLRPWMALTMAKLPFIEEMILLDTPEFKSEVARHSGAGRVPVLYHGKLMIWDSLAILEYLADAFPQKGLWPATAGARAMARSAASEMHSGFQALRNACPMNLRRPKRSVAMDQAVHKDVARIEALWRTARDKHAKGGKFLFGKFSNADAMFAPVVTRLETYDIAVANDTREYMANVVATDAFAAWKEAALKETWVVPSDEVD